jgi:hypothetical protein
MNSRVRTWFPPEILHHLHRPQNAAAKLSRVQSSRQQGSNDTKQEGQVIVIDDYTPVPRIREELCHELEAGKDVMRDDMNAATLLGRSYVLRKTPLTFRIAEPSLKYALQPNAISSMSTLMRQRFLKPDPLPLIAD